MNSCDPYNEDVKTSGLTWRSGNVNIRFGPVRMIATKNSIKSYNPKMTENRNDCRPSSPSRNFAQSAITNEQQQKKKSSTKWWLSCPTTHTFFTLQVISSSQCNGNVASLISIRLCVTKSARGASKMIFHNGDQADRQPHMMCSIRGRRVTTAQFGVRVRSGWAQSIARPWVLIKPYWHK